MRDSWLGLCPRKLSRDKNLEFILELFNRFLLIEEKIINVIKVKIPILSRITGKLVKPCILKPAL